MARVVGFWKKVGDTIQPVFNSGVNLLIRGVNKYINFNENTGEAGYGFRDNDGVIEHKSLGGEWLPVGSGGGGAEPAGVDRDIQFNDGGSALGASTLFKYTTTNRLQHQAANGSVSVGNATSDAIGSNAIDISSGRVATANAARSSLSIAIGYDAHVGTNASNATGGIAIGSNQFGVRTYVRNTDGIAIGSRAQVDGNSGAIALGGGALVTVGDIAIGYNAQSTQFGTIVIGKTTLATLARDAILIGNQITQLEQGEVRIGRARHNTTTSGNKTLYVPLRHAIIGTTDNTTDSNWLTPISPDPSAVLQLEATPNGGQGFLLPRHTTTTRNAVTSPATGLQIYNTDTNEVDYYNGTVWQAVPGRNKRIGTVASAAAPAINTDLYDIFNITAQAEDITSMSTNLTGTPVAGQQLLVTITGTAARAVVWGASFANGPVELPTTTVTTTKLSALFIHNGTVFECYATGSTV